MAEITIDLTRSFDAKTSPAFAMTPPRLSICDGDTLLHLDIDVEGMRELADTINHFLEGQTNETI